MGLDNLEMLFKANHKRLYAIALSITKEGCSAEDAVHDALLSVSAVHPQPIDQKSYLFRTVRNKALNCVRMARRLESLASDFLVLANDDPEQQALVAQATAQLMQMDAKYQQAVILKLFGGLTFREIALAMDAPANTVASWYRRGIIILQERLNANR